MPLSDYEKEVLAQMEAQLSDQDPKLVDQMRGSARFPRVTSRPRRVAFGVVLMLLGIIVLVGGLVASPYLQHLQVLGTLTGVLGFVVVVLGVLQILGILSTPHSRRVPSRKPAVARSGGSFMERQQDKWNRRQNPQS